MLTAYTSALALPDVGPDAVTVPAGLGFLAARLPVAGLALGSVAVLMSAVNRYLDASGLPPRDWRLDPERVAASFGSDALIRIDGAPVNGFAPMSGFFATDDGWIRTHANYPHHRIRLLAALQLPADASVDDLARTLARRSAGDVERRAIAEGALAARVQSESDWRAEQPEGRPPIVEYRASGSADRVLHAATDVHSPLAGVRVLDMTRVLAGPVAGRDLALLGADVLRVDPPFLPEIEWQHTATGAGKRTTLLDLRLREDRRVIEDLMARADVLLTGYRPGALEALGIETGQSGLIHGSVCARDPRGHRAGQRGFDSLVQATTGISLIEGDGRPGALPVQALDHASGHLMAAAVIDALARRLVRGEGARLGVILERTATFLLDAPGRLAGPEPARAPGERTLVTENGVTTERPPLVEYDTYAFAARPWGRDSPAWRECGR